MDPNETLRLLREWADPDAEADVEVGVWAVVEAFRALDEWLSKGGFLPEPWERGMA